MFSPLFELFLCFFPSLKTIPTWNVSVLKGWEQFILPIEGAGKVFKDMQIISRTFFFSIKTDLFDSFWNRRQVSFVWYFIIYFCITSNLLYFSYWSGFLSFILLICCHISVHFTDLIRILFHFSATQFHIFFVSQQHFEELHLSADFNYFPADWQRKERNTKRSLAGGSHLFTWAWKGGVYPFCNI